MATILITGTNKGVGLELVKIYAARGDTVIATCRDPESASALSEVGGAVEVLRACGTADGPIAWAAPFEGIEAGSGNTERPGHHLHGVLGLICAPEPEDRGDVASFVANQAAAFERMSRSCLS